MENHYHILGITPTATSAEVQDAYTRKRAELLAARDDDSPETLEALAKLDQAYIVLNNPSERTAYDRASGIDRSPSSLVIANQPDAIVKAQETLPPQVQQPCPHCGALNPVQATFCIKCDAQISRPCPNCGVSVVLSQGVCPRCNIVIPEYQTRQMTQGMVVEEQVKEERIEAAAETKRLNAIFNREIQFGCVFWIVVVAIFVGLCGLAFLAFYFGLNNL
jgi:hypothetical protein